MSHAVPLFGLIGLVATILVAHRQPNWQRLFRWLPVPLWCYLLPALATGLGWLPVDASTYRAVMGWLLPVALALLLFGTDLFSLRRLGGAVLFAAVIGALGVILGAALGVCLLRRWLPSDAWQGAGALAGTWTGGTMNLLALRTLLNTPDAIFSPLILVDALIAYTWMALLVTAAGWAGAINIWLRASPDTLAHSDERTADAQPLPAHAWLATAGGVTAALGLMGGARWLAGWLPTSPLISSSSGWMILLVTTGALAASLLPPLRRLGEQTAPLGYAGLYLVLAATGAQASLAALWSAPIWLAVGLVIVLTHGSLLLLVGRWRRIPLGLLATASQANIGGVVSAPLVADVYSPQLTRIGLLLAVAGNAVGTYLGWAAAALTRWLTRA